MAARRGVQNYQKTIKTMAEWEASINEDNKRLTMVDVHSPWCGPCTLMASITKSIALKIDEWEKRIEFLIVSTELIPELAEFQNGSKPKFLFYQNGRMLVQVEGMNVPLMNKIIADNLPELED